MIRAYLVGVVMYGLWTLVGFTARERVRILRALSRALLWPATLAEHWFKRYYSFRRRSANRIRLDA